MRLVEDEGHLRRALELVADDDDDDDGLEEDPALGVKTRGVDDRICSRENHIEPVAGRDFFMPLAESGADFDNALGVAT